MAAEGIAAGVTGTGSCATSAWITAGLASYPTTPPPPLSTRAALTVVPSRSGKLALKRDLAAADAAGVVAVAAADLSHALLDEVEHSRMGGGDGGEEILVLDANSHGWAN